MVVDIMPFKILACANSDVGLVRENNEDFWDSISELNFFALADGMGGHRAGEVASKEAVKIFCQLIQRYHARKKGATFHEIREVYPYLIEQVNSHVYELSRNDEQLKGMGTTLCCIQFFEHGVLYAHVGDSRIYRLHRGKFEQLTSDHSLLKELRDLGHTNASEIPEFLYKNIITRAIGTEPVVEPTVQTCRLVDGDIFLMCTDGLSDLLSSHEIHDILKKNEQLEDCVTKLISMARERGGHDNITVVVMKVCKDHEHADLS